MGFRTWRFGAILAVVALTAAVVMAARQGRSFTGGGKYISGNGWLVEFGANGVEHPDGTVTGSGQTQIKSTGFKMHFDVIDVVFDGNTAWVLGEVTRGDAGALAPFFGTADLAGWQWLQGVTDNGQGKNQAPDRISGSPLWLGPVGWTGISQAEVNFLLGIFPALAPTSPLTAGNIQVSGD